MTFASFAVRRASESVSLRGLGAPFGTGEPRLERRYPALQRPGIDAETCGHDDGRGERQPCRARRSHGPIVRDAGRATGNHAEHAAAQLRARRVLRHRVRECVRDRLQRADLGEADRAGRQVRLERPTFRGIERAQVLYRRRQRLFVVRRAHMVPRPRCPTARPQLQQSESNACLDGAQGPF